jgi:hypothetical protein
VPLRTDLHQREPGFIPVVPPHQEVGIVDTDYRSVRASVSDAVAIFVECSAGVAAHAQVIQQDLSLGNLLFRSDH